MLTGGVKGPTNTSSFLRVQQGGEVEAAPDLVAAQGRGAKGLWLSEKRQAGGPGERALSFGTIALPVSVGAQRVRPGACTGQGGRIQKGQYFTQTNTAHCPVKALFDTTVSIQTVQKESQIPSGEGAREEWSVLLGSPTPNPPAGTVGPDWRHSRGRWHQGHSAPPSGQGARPAALSRLKFSLRVGGVLSRPPPKTRMIQKKKVEPQEPVSVPHVLCFLGQHYAHSIQSGAQGR